MRDALFLLREKYVYSDSQTGAYANYFQIEPAIDEIAPLGSRIIFHPVLGNTIYDIGSSGLGRAKPRDHLSEKRKRYSPAMRAAAMSGAFLVIVGLSIGIAYPGPITGAIFPVGLIVFSVVGWLARHQDRVSN